MSERLHTSALLIGQAPPPSGGTSVPFKALVEYIERQCSIPIVICNTHGPGQPLAQRGIIAATSAVRRVLRTAVSARVDAIFLSASQRYVCTVGCLLMIVALWRRIPVYVYVHGGGFDEYYKRLMWPVRFLVRGCLRSAARLFVQTQFLRSRLSAELPNLTVVPNWTTARRMTPRTPRRSFVRFVYAGEIRQDKGIAELLVAFAAAHDRMAAHGQTVTLDIFGPLRDRNLENDLKLPNLQAGITYHGYTAHDELMTQLEDADVLVLPTYQATEGYPGVLLEAMRLGLCIITTNWRAIPELVQNERNGLVCPPRDAAMLRAAIERVAVDHRLRERLARKAEAKGVHYTAERVLKRLCRTCGFTC